MFYFGRETQQSMNCVVLSSMEETRKSKFFLETKRMSRSFICFIREEL